MYCLHLGRGLLGLRGGLLAPLPGGRLFKHVAVLAEQLHPPRLGHRLEPRVRPDLAGMLKGHR